MPEPIVYFDRVLKKNCHERVYGGWALKFLLGNSIISKCIGRPLNHFIAKNASASCLYGKLQSTRFTKQKIVPFIKKFQLDPSEFEKEPSQFTSFNDFFIRKLKKEARPIDLKENTAIIPADGRYLFFSDIDQVDGFLVKGKKFDLKTLLQSEHLSRTYKHASMAIARLCPMDYHRFHFPCDCTPSETTLINGPLYSVNPMALRQNISIFSENKRTLCTLNSTRFGDILFLEIGATFVGSIHETYSPNQPALKGNEKGYFSFGGSSLILLFPPGSIAFDKDLLKASLEGIEIKCLMGQSMGSSYP